MQSPFTGLNSAALEIKNLFSNGWKVFSVVAITFIPLVYAGLFLLAFLDPYGSLSNVPAVVVNQDAGSNINGQQRYIGQELCDSLIENNAEATEGEASGYKWEFVSDIDSAYKGLEDGQYYMMLVIPENFSENIGSAVNSNPQHAELQAYFNPSTNLIAQTVGSSMVTSIRAQLNEKVSHEYIENIFVKLTDASSDMTTAVNGAADLTDGLKQAADGSNTITVNLGTLSSGATSLDSGLSELASGTQSLESGVGQLSSGAKELDGGAAELESGGEALGSGAAQLVDGANSLDSGVGQIAGGLDTLDGGAGQLASGADSLDAGLGTLSSGAAQVSSGAQQLANNAGALASGSQSLSDGLTSLDANSESLVQGSSQVASGLSQLKAGSDLYQQGITAAIDAASTAGIDITAAKAQYAAALQTYSASPTQENMAALNDAVNNLATVSGNLGAYSALSSVQTSYAQLAAGISDLNSNYVALNAGIEQYTAGVAELKAGAEQLNAGVGEAAAGINSLNSGASGVAAGAASAKNGSAQLSSGALGVKSGTATLLDGALSAKAGSSALAAGLGSAASGADALIAGLKTFRYGVASLSSGAAAAYDGAGKLTSGALSAKSGAGQIASGAAQLRDGSDVLTSGIQSAADGSQTLADGLDSGQKQMEENVENSDVKTDVISEPVQANGVDDKGENITEVKNYGTGFAPYFIGLGMWVGCLMISFLLRSLNNRILMTRSNTFAAVLSSYLPMLLIAVVQVVVLLATVQFGLGFNVNYPVHYYLFGLLVAACFVAIIQFFRAAFGTAGMVIIVILLMLQLCTAAGTFPIQAEIEVFNILNPFLPMTYVVRGFRMAMCGLSASYMVQPAAVLAAFLIVFLALTTAVAQSRRRVKMNTMYPKIKMAA